MNRVMEDIGTYGKLKKKKSIGDGEKRRETSIVI